MVVNFTADPTLFVLIRIYIISRKWVFIKTILDFFHIGFDRLNSQLFRIKIT